MSKLRNLIRTHKLFSATVGSWISAFVTEFIVHVFVKEAEKSAHHIPTTLNGWITFGRHVVHYWFLITAVGLMLWFLSWLYSRYKLSALADNAGLCFFLPYSCRDDISKIEKTLFESLKEVRDIKILGATGYNTFGRPGSFLCDILENTAARIEVILLDPAATNEALRFRANELRMSLVAYREEIINSIEKLKELKQRGKHISLYLYHHMPQWKLYITNDKVWVQNYRQGTHVSETSIFGFRRNSAERNFYDYYVDLFNRLVAKLGDRGHLVDLENWVPPDDLGPR